MRSNLALGAGALVGATAGLAILFVLNGGLGGEARPNGAATRTPAATNATNPKRPAPEPPGRVASSPPAAKPAPASADRAGTPQNPAKLSLPSGFGAGGKPLAGGPAIAPPPPPEEKKPPKPVTDRVSHGISGFRDGIDLAHPVTLAGNKGPLKLPADGDSPVTGEGLRPPK